MYSAQNWRDAAYHGPAFEIVGDFAVMGSKDRAAAEEWLADRLVDIVYAEMDAERASRQERSQRNVL